MTEIGQYLDLGRKMREKASLSKEKELNKCERIDRAMETLQMQEFNSHLREASDVDDNSSLENSTPHWRQPETKQGHGSSSVDLGRVLRKILHQSQATADTYELSLALEEVKKMKSDRDGFAVDQIKDRGKQAGSLKSFSDK